MNAQKAIALLQSIRAEFTGVGEVERRFSIHKQFGLCWHFQINSISAERINFRPIFESLGLDKTYPVEMQIQGISDQETAEQFYSFGSYHKYDQETEHGKIRLKLIDDLIEYFKAE